MDLAQAKDQFAKLSDELQANDRLRWGLWVIAAILVLQAVFVLSDRVAEVTSETQSLHKRLHKVALIEQQTEWGQRFAAESAVQIQLHERLWQARSEGLAKASLQAAIDQLAEHANIKIRQLQLSDPEPMSGVANIVQVRAELNAQLRRGSIPELLDTLATHEPPLFVDTLSMRIERNKTVKLQVMAYFALGEAGKRLATKGKQESAP